MLILPYAEEIQNMSNCFGKNKVIRYIDFICELTYNITDNGIIIEIYKKI